MIATGTLGFADTPTKAMSQSQYMKIDDQAAATELPAFPDADARRQAFEQRNSPEQIEALAKKLFTFWDFNERRSSHSPATDSIDHDKAHIVELYQKQDYDGALKAYRDYFIHKLHLLWYTEPSQFSEGFTNRGNSEDDRNHFNAMVNLAMKGDYQTPVTKETVHLGDPGQVHWEWKASAMQSAWADKERPEIEYFGGSPFDTLWWKFVDTKDHTYLDKWYAYLDDYTMNDKFQWDLNALNLDLGKEGISDTMGFFAALLHISDALPQNDEVIPETTFARMMLRQVELIIPQSSFYNRQQSNNHEPVTTANFLRISEFIYDFKFAKTLEQECRRQFEAYGTLDARPDGAGPGRLPGYALFEFRENLPIIHFLRLGNYPWMTPMQNREYRDREIARAVYTVLVTTPTGEFRVGVNTDDRRTVNFEDITTMFDTYYPELYNDPDMFRITSLILKNLARPNWQGSINLPPETPLTNMGLGSVKADEPSYDSYSFPYDRINVMGNGWDPNKNQYGVLLGEAAHRGDSYVKENKATNHFVISAFNRDIFRAGVSYAYNYLHSPMTVDGQDEFSGAGEGPTARRASAQPGLDPISKDRIHYSDTFDVAESTYDWAYVNTGENDPTYYDYHTKLDAAAHAIWNVSHHRLVQFVKKHGFWIVTDLMTSPHPHEYAQQWWLAELTKNQPDGFLQTQVHEDANAQTFKSDAADAVNFSMYHVGPVDLDKGKQAMKLKYDPIGERHDVDTFQFKGPRNDREEGSLYIQLHGSWKSQGGRSQLVTVIYPRKTVGDDLASLVPNKAGNGFVAKLKDGSEVDYAASMGKAGSLSVAGIDADAESLLVLKEGGKTSGIVLGCDSIHGHGVKKDSADFEFDGTSTSPIYRPIQPVEIGPGVDGFSDKIDVTMKTVTPGTDIRYTVDGSDPTLASTLYSGPVTFTDTVLLKVRAFRKGLDKMPALTPTGVDMTSVETAVFTKQLFHDADTWTTTTKPGLAYDYYENKWPYFIYDVNPTLSPLKSGEVTSLIDTTPKSPDLKQAFAFVYHGYLDIPADGVYTIYAPDSFTHYRPLSGYDLKVDLGYEIHTESDGKRKVSGSSPMVQWYPATRSHAFGTWSIALKKGLQPLRVYFADMRPGGELQYQQVTYPGWNVPGLTKVVWDGDVPELDISGPGLKRQPIPKDWLKHE